MSSGGPKLIRIKVVARRLAAVVYSIRSLANSGRNDTPYDAAGDIVNYVHIVAVLAVLQFFFFGILVGRARKRHSIKAPATTGHESFERAFRVHMNTQEQLIGFLPALLIAAVYWPNDIVAGVGVVYLAGRFLYRHLYLRDPARRRPGFLLTVVPTFVLLAAALVGAITRHAG